MSEQPKLSVLQRVLLTITREEDEEKLLEIYDSMHLPICFQGRGQGTAPSELLDIFGLRGTSRLLTACILPKFMVPSALEALHQKLSFRQRGGGIAITVPVSGMQSHVMQMLNEEARNAIQQQEKGDEAQMKEKSEFSLIWVSVASGYSDEVAIVAHQYNTESSVERVEAFKKEIEEKYTDVKVVQVNYGDGEESIADMLKNTLETYPALKGIFCTNEDMADQTLDALADMENTEQIQIVGFDSGEKQQKAIQEGREYGTVTQNPYGLGYAAIVAAVRAIQGLPVDQKIDTGYQWIDKDTIDLETNQKYLYN